MCLNKHQYLCETCLYEHLRCQCSHKDSFYDHQCKFLLTVLSQSWPSFLVLYVVIVLAYSPAADFGRLRRLRMRRSC